MVDPTIVASVKRYLAFLPTVGIHPSRGVLIGSFARGQANEWSDIDLVVVAPEFDEAHDHALIEDMWGVRQHTDYRIEPIPCGEKEWETDGSRPIIEVARQEGIIIAA